MKKSIIKTIVTVCFIFVFGISSAFALKNIDNTYAVSYNYTARFYPNGGSWVSGNANDYYRGVPYSERYYFTNEKVKIKKDGCQFGGWKVESTGKILQEYIDSAENGENLYAVWNNCKTEETPTYYKVSFNLNGGSGSSSTQTIKDGGLVSRPGNPTKNGYTFQHWSTTSSGSAYNFNTQVKSSFTLYAVWKINTYTISFNLNGGNGNINNQTINYGSTVSKPNNPTRDGYTFQHWSTSSSGTAFNFNTQVKSNFTLYAIWKKNETSTPQPVPQPNPTPTPTPTPSVTYYNIKFDLNGGTGDIPNQSIAKGNKIVKPNDPVKDNASFNGWSTNNSCNKMYDFNSSVNNDLTLYACFTNNYKINISMQGLPFIENYSKVVKEKSNLNDYRQQYSIIVFDTTTYSMPDTSSCISKLKEINSNREESQLKERCNYISKKINCSNNSECYGNKYVALTNTESEDIIYLKKNNVINVEYEVYNYIGLYRDRECKDEYKYGNSITKDLNLYECFKLNENKEIISNKDTNKKKRNTGTTITIFLILAAIISVVLFVLYLIRKSKISNSV